MNLTPEERQEIEQAVDAAFVRLYGRSFRDEEPNEILDNIMKDCPDLFGKP